MVLVVAVEEYLCSPLIRLSGLLYPGCRDILGIKATRKLSPIFILKLFLWYLPFKARAVITPSDLGGRLVRLMLDWARLLGKEVLIVPVHNHPSHRDRPLPIVKRYLDLTTLRVVGGFARHSKIIVNDAPMREFFLGLGYAPERLVLMEGWITRLFREEQAARYPVVFFTEVLQEVCPEVFGKNAERVVSMLERGALRDLYIKFHPRESEEAIGFYRKTFGRFANAHFIEGPEDSMAIINRAGAVMASFSSVLLEGLWLGKKVIILDNPVFRQTLLNSYLQAGENHFVMGDNPDLEGLRRFLGKGRI